MKSSINQPTTTTLLTLAALLIAACATAQQAPITTAVPFLRINPDAAAAGRGNTGIAMTPGASTAFWNPGAVVFNKEKGGLTANYTPWMRELSGGMYLASLSGYYKWTENQSFHGSLRYFNQGNLQFTDQNGAHLQQFKAREWTVEGGYSRKLSVKSSLGLTLRYIHSNLADKSSGGDNYNAAGVFAVDLGYYFQNHNAEGSGWSFGAALTNLGAKVGYSKADQKDFIPANLGIGTAYTKSIGEQHSISFGLDINKSLVPMPPTANDANAWTTYRSKSVMNSWFTAIGNIPKGTQINLGAEYWYNKLFALRAGYSLEDKHQGNRKFFTAGAGLKYHTATINFAYLVATGNGTTPSPLNNTASFGLMLDILK